MAELWYYYRQGQKTGPLSPEQLLDAAGAGKFGPGDRVWSSGMEEPMLASEVPELAGVLKARAAQAQAERPAATAATRRAGQGGRFQDRITQALDDRQAASSRKKRSDVAQVPSSVLTVEYVDGSEGMDAALKTIEQRLASLEQLAREMQETVSQLVTAVNKQEKETEQTMESLGRRVDRVFRQMAGGATVVGARPDDIATLGMEEESLQFPPQFTGDEDHQKAWQIAQVMTADLEAYYEDQIREGVLYDNLTEVLANPIGEARRTYQERAAKAVQEEFDYFELALQRLIARKKQELTSEESPE